MSANRFTLNCWTAAEAMFAAYGLVLAALRLAPAAPVAAVRETSIVIATALAGALTAASVLIGWRRPSRAKQQPYECGMEPIGDARAPFSVKFYLVAMVFILFDVEAIFLYPWAYIFRSLRWYGFVEMMMYIAILLVGYLYLWKKGALDWHK